MMIGREKNLDFERSKKHKQPAENKNRNQQDFWKKNHVQKKHAYESQKSGKSSKFSLYKSKRTWLEINSHKNLKTLSIGKTKFLNVAWFKVIFSMRTINITSHFTELENVTIINKVISVTLTGNSSS